MFKLRKITFKDHPILGNLELDFCVNGKPADTVILAGENGTGKSTILKMIQQLDESVNVPMGNVAFLDSIECEQGNKVYNFRFKKNASVNYIKFSDGREIMTGTRAKEIFKISSIYADVGINYNISPIRSSTSKDIDKVVSSRHSNEAMAQEIAQLFVDIEELDNAKFKRTYMAFNNAGRDTNNLIEAIDFRMDRFKKAFAKIFSDLEWDGVENEGDSKVIYFKNAKGKVRLIDMSSGEKQIVFRGGFLLKDRNALNGALVLIDEPEISMHPEWQKRIMDFYKGIFTQSNGTQTSQIFAVTHSPFIIHNEKRYNDKVIVLKKREDGTIYVEDHPEYYKANAIRIVEDAFNIYDFSYPSKNTVYVEGRTDEVYLNKCAEVFDIELPYDIKWIGHLDERGQERNTGKDALNQAWEFLMGRDNSIKSVLLYDCDTNKRDEEKNNVFIRVLPHYENDRFHKGIENALKLDGIDLSEYYTMVRKTGDYGEKKEYETFEKMKCCADICSMEKEKLKRIFGNLKDIIEMLNGLLM